MLKKITGWFGPLVGGLFFALIMFAFVGFTKTDSGWRVLGFVLGLIAFIGFTALGIANEKKRTLNDKASQS